MELLNKHWRKIVIILLVIFSLSTCAKTCSKSNDIRKVNKELNEANIKLDSIGNIISYQKGIIDSLEYEVKLVSKERDIYKKTSDNYKSSLDKASSKRTTISVNVPKQESKKEIEK
jgi:hypothetical protein